MSLTAVIIDDEAHCQEALGGLLASEHADVQLLGTAGSVEAGLELIGSRKPDIIFLDVELGDRTGFDLLEALGADRPHVIFTTGHESYAVKAIRFSALDYLLKPVDADELAEALGKAEAQQRTPQTAEQFLSLMQNLARTDGAGGKLALPVSDGLELVDPAEILYCESDSNYTVVHQQGKKRLVISRTLKEFEDMLKDRGFVRVHHSYLINTRHVKKYIRGEGGEVIMEDGTNVAVSRRKKQELMDSLARL
ncbi:MAG: LytTR family DNA-binding domain-containing protein [Flavobacteriales bacterium]